MSALEGLIFGYRLIRVSGVDAPVRSKLNFIGGATVTDNEATGATDISVSAGQSASVVVASATLTANKLVHVNPGVGPGGAAIVITLPTSPVLGDAITIKRMVGNITRVVTVNGGSVNVEQFSTDTLATTLTLESGDSAVLNFNGTYWGLV